VVFVNQESEKELLYYCGLKDRHNGIVMFHNGDVIYEHYFINVKTGEKIILASCYDSKNIKNYYYEKIYDDILSAANDYDILWKITGKGVIKLDEDFEQIKRYYLNLLKLEVSYEYINSIMLEKYVGWKKIIPNNTNDILEKLH
jgi:hypothetical protein